MQSIKKQLEPKPFKEVELHKSAGILDDYAVRKDIQTRGINTPLITSHSGAISFDNENLTTTGTITAEHLKTTDDLEVADDILLGSGSVINWNSGDVTLTHSSNTLTFAGIETFNLGSGTSIKAGYGNVSLGPFASASGYGAIAIGESASTLNDGSIVLGPFAQASNDFAIAIGDSAQANGYDSIAIGLGVQATNTSSIAIGSAGYDGFVISSGVASIVIGTANDEDTIEASGDASMAMGYATKASATKSIAIGSLFTNSVASSFAVGFGQKDLEVKSGEVNVTSKLTMGTLVIPTKTTTGDPSSPVEGQIYTNTYDNKVRIYTDGSWRDLITW